MGRRDGADPAPGGHEPPPGPSLLALLARDAWIDAADGRAGPAFRDELGRLCRAIQGLSLLLVAAGAVLLAGDWMPQPVRWMLLLLPLPMMAALVRLQHDPFSFARLRHAVAMHQACFVVACWIAWLFLAWPGAESVLYLRARAGLMLAITGAGLLAGIAVRLSGWLAPPPAFAPLAQDRALPQASVVDWLRPCGLYTRADALVFTLSIPVALLWIGVTVVQGLWAMREPVWFPVMIWFMSAAIGGAWLGAIACSGWLAARRAFPSTRIGDWHSMRPRDPRARR
jgi:hypothetical protein